jgi:dethiobiotin synthetase
MAEEGETGTGSTSTRGRSLFETERLERASWAFTTRRVPRNESFRVSREPMTPRAGDLVLARVDLLGHHKGLQLCSGRKRQLFPGDEIVAVYGNRYAPNQFEAVVPKTLGPCQLVAGGGVAAKALSWHSRISRGPTEITPIGLLLRPDGEAANLSNYAMAPADQLIERCPPTIAVVGTAMDAGKTSSAAFLCRGLINAGINVGFAKITGTGAGGDTWLLKDAGAKPVLDFIDAGFVSTYRVSIEEIERVLVTLMTHLTKAGVDAIVIEIADGVLQPETAALLESPVFKSIVGGVLFTARDSMGAAAGVEWLRQRELPVAGLSGVLTTAPLQSSEASAATGLPVLSLDELANADVARKLFGQDTRELTQ